MDATAPRFPWLVTRQASFRLLGTGGGSSLDQAQDHGQNRPTKHVSSSASLEAGGPGLDPRPGPLVRPMSTERRKTIGVTLVP